MKIVLAPNAYKGSLSAREAAAAMALGAVRALPDTQLVAVPVADGGDGLVDVALDALGGEMRRATVSDPLGRPIEAAWCYVPERRFAAVEMALASGLALLDANERSATRTTTLGTGQLIAAALDAGARHIGVGIGGSATNDGGIGAAAALGIRFLDADGAEVAPVGASLASLATVDTRNRDPRLEAVRVEAVCDVDNVLCGPQGAAAVYGPQKGASPDDVEQLDAGLRNLADIVRRDLGIDVAGLPGAGAAGGLGAGLVAFVGATLRPGSEMVLELVGLERHLDGADLVITGEGRIDRQTLFGKAPAAVAAAARAHGARCIVVAGSVADDLGDVRSAGIDAVYSLAPDDMPLSERMARAAGLLADATEAALRDAAAGERRQ